MNQYINLRDFDKRIVYAGYPQVFSESEKMRELVLRDVEVYDFDGNLLYRMPHIYVARQPDDIHLEFPYDPSANRAGGR